MVEVLGGIECYAAHHLARGVVDELQLDMLEVAPNELTGAEILYITGAEHRLLVARPERIEAPEQVDKLP